MSEILWLYYNGWGILSLAIFAGGYSAAHYLWLRNLKFGETIAKMVGFGGLVTLFIVSGWKGGLIGLGLGIGVSWVSLFLFACLLRTPNQTKGDNRVA
jgi:hypothetical protein